MKYLEVKEFIESLPENPLVEYVTEVMIDPEKMTAEPDVQSVEVVADFNPGESGPYAKCFLELSEEDNDQDYRVYTRFEFEPGYEEQEKLANKVFGMMKEFACKQMIRSNND